MTVLNDTSYQARIQQFSKQLDDQIIKPMDLGAFWTEFLLRHKKPAVKKYFRSHYPDLPYLASDNYDLFLLVLGLALIIVKLVR